MVQRCVRSRLTIALLSVLFISSWVACGSQIRTQGRAVTPAVVVPPVAVAPLPPTAAPPPPQDPVFTLIAASERDFETGQRELQLGHVDAARMAFDRSIEGLLESPYGGRTEPRIREHFDRLVDRISTYELKALGEGDGFAEKAYDSASIDDLLSLSTTFDTVAPTAELKDIVQSDLQRIAHDIPIPLNERVLSYIELFQGRLHDFIELGMKRGSKYLPMIQNVFRAEGLPLDLAYVPLIESAFNPNALSRTKAKGVWQFMSGTATENGLRRDWYVDERSDPEKATVAAAKYLKVLNELFDGDWHLALASYNGGPGRMQRAVKRLGGGDFWKLASTPKLLPRETREYVPMILAAMVVARNPAQYGFEIVPEEASAFDRISLPRPVDLRRVAEWAGTTIDEIRALNPELRRWTTPVKATQYELRVPAGTGDDVMARIEEAPAGDLASLKWYTVKRGETLPIIARKLKVSRGELAEANDLSVKAKVAAGQRLMVPYEATVLMAARTERVVPVAESRPIAENPGLMAQAVPTGDRVKKILYEVQAGDTLFSIARVFKTTVASLRSWNRLASTRIAVGARLTVYTARQAD